MRKILIFDTTLRDGEQSPGNSMHASEKLDFALQLEKLGVNIIEAGFPASSQGDLNSVREIAQSLKKATVCALARAKKEDIDAAYTAVKDAAFPRIHVFLATSPIHLKYKLKMTEDEVLEKIKTSVAYAKSLIPDVQFSCEDASRSEKEFLLKAIKVAISAGATTINIPDTVGYSMPSEISELFSYLISEINRPDIVFSTHCHNDLGLAVANTLAAIKAGATQAECTVNGIGERAGNASMEEIVMATRVRSSLFNLTNDIDTIQIYKTSKLLSSITGVKIPPTKPIVGKNVFTHESGIHQHGIIQNAATYEIMTPESVGITENNLLLGKHSGKHAFKEYLEKMGASVSKAELDILFEKFKTIADRKKSITHKDIEYLLTHTNTIGVKKTFTLEKYDISSHKGGAIAKITINGEGGMRSAETVGDGPLDAAYNAINTILGKDFTLEDYSVSAVSEGEDALGAATLRLSYNGVTMTGRGISTDIVEASILAYLNGCNKLTEE